MNTLVRMAAVAVAASAATLSASDAADAAGQISIGIGVPGVGIHIGPPVHRVVAPAYYYGPGYYPPGPCDAYGYYYSGDCGYAVYDGRIFVNGAWVYGPHYYRWYNGAPLFWYRGGWYLWPDWVGVSFGWNRFEGWGWHGGRWDRGWGNAHGGWHGPVHVRDAHSGLGHDDHRDVHTGLGHDHVTTTTHVEEHHTQPGGHPQTDGHGDEHPH